MPADRGSCNAEDDGMCKICCNSGSFVWSAENSLQLIGVGKWTLSRWDGLSATMLSLPLICWVLVGNWLKIKNSESNRENAYPFFVICKNRKKKVAQWFYCWINCSKFTTKCTISLLGWAQFLGIKTGFQQLLSNTAPITRSDASTVREMDALDDGCTNKATFARSCLQSSNAFSTSDLLWRWEYISVEIYHS